MNLQNGYKVIYEKASDGTRTFYASKTGICDPTVDTQLGETFTDADFAGKVIYEYKGGFYVSTGATPAYDENGVPTDERLSAFDEVFVATENSEDTAGVDEGNTEPEVLSETEEPTESDPEEPEAEATGDEPATEPEATEPEVEPTEPEDETNLEETE